MSSGKSSGQVRSEIDTTGSGSATGELVERSRTPPRATDAHLRDQRSRGGHVETVALVAHRRRRDARFDSSIRRRSTTSWSAEAVTAMAQPK